LVSTWSSVADGRANRAQFTDVALRHIAETDEVADVSLPSVQGVEEDAGMFPLVITLTKALAGFTPVGAPEYTDIYTTPDQLTEGLLTLSLMPRSRWQTLLNLETIKVSPQKDPADLSNGINPRNHPRPRSKHHSSCQLWLVLKRASISLRLPLLKLTSPTRDDWTFLLALSRATSLDGWRGKIPKEIVSVSSCDSS
jgi:hypothetical protein